MNDNVVYIVTNDLKSVALKVPAAVPGGLVIASDALHAVHVDVARDHHILPRAEAACPAVRRKGLAL